MTSALLGALPFANSAQELRPAARPRVAVVYEPDRPSKYWRDGMCASVQTSLMLSALDFEHIGFPGLDWSKLILDAFVPALNAKYPQAEFFAIPEYSERASPQLNEYEKRDIKEGRPLYRDQAVLRELSTELMKSSGAVALVNLSSSDASDTQRQQRYGGLRLDHVGVTDSFWSLKMKPEKWVLRLSMGLEIGVYDDKRGYYAGRQGFSNGNHFVSIPNAWGERSDISGFFDSLVGSREYIAARVQENQALMLEGFKLAGILAAGTMRGMETGLGITHQRDPQMYNLPFGP